MARHIYSSDVPSHPLDDQRVHMVPESEQQVDAGSAGRCW